MLFQKFRGGSAQSFFIHFFLDANIFRFISCLEGFQHALERPFGQGLELGGQAVADGAECQLQAFAPTEQLVARIVRIAEQGLFKPGDFLLDGFGFGGGPGFDLINLLGGGQVDEFNPALVCGDAGQNGIRFLCGLDDYGSSGGLNA